METKETVEDLNEVQEELSDGEIRDDNEDEETLTLPEKTDSPRLTKPSQAQGFDLRQHIVFMTKKRKSNSFHTISEKSFSKNDHGKESTSRYKSKESSLKVSHEKTTKESNQAILKKRTKQTIDREKEHKNPRKRKSSSKDVDKFKTQKVNFTLFI